MAFGLEPSMDIKSVRTDLMIGIVFQIDLRGNLGIVHCQVDKRDLTKLNLVFH